jgi:hypothetical protein
MLALLGFLTSDEIEDVESHRIKGIDLPISFILICVFG